MKNDDDTKVLTYHIQTLTAVQDTLLALPVDMGFPSKVLKLCIDQLDETKGMLISCRAKQKNEKEAA